MVIHQGDIFWLPLEEPIGSEPGYRRPYVIVQNDRLNAGPIRTVITCLVTSNIRLALARGNVLLDQGEGNLPKRSVVNVSQIFTLDKGWLEENEYIGALSPQRVRQILDGIRLVLEPMEV